MTIIGIDPHKSSLTAVALNTQGVVLGQRRLVVNKGTGPALLKWSSSYPEVVFAVEGAKGLGHGIAQFLVGHQQRVLDVPATLSIRVRVLSTGGGRKTDPYDAQAVAMAALLQKHLKPVEAEDHNTVLGLLTQARDALKCERTKQLNRLHRLLRELIDGGVPRGLTVARAKTALKNLRPRVAADLCRRDLAEDLVVSLVRLEAQMDKYEQSIADALASTATKLMDIQGISILMAGKILGETAGVSRFSSSAHFASYTGAAPLDASSGENKRQRLNMGGNRQLNLALHMIAVCQIQHRGKGQDYYLRKVAEGKTPREARRALKRRLSNVIYRTMVADERRREAVIC